MSYRYSSFPGKLNLGLIALLLLITYASSAYGDINLAILPSPVIVQQDEVFDVELTITEAGSAFNGFDAIVGYDPSMLTFIEQSYSVQKGSLIRDACPSPDFHQFSIADDSTHVSITYIMLCAGVSVTGPGVVYNLRFQAKFTDGTTYLTFLEGTQFYLAGIVLSPLFTEDAEVIIGNNPPNAVDDAATVVEGGTVNIDVLTNDSDPEDDPLTIIAVTQGTNGAVTSDGATVTYVHDGTETTSDSFTYTIEDGNGGTDTATVTMTITPMNDPPDATDDSATVLQGGTAIIPVLDNDHDPENDTLSIIAITQGSNGMVITDGTIVIYSHDGSATTSDSFTYTISDGNGGTDTATVMITVQPTTTPPENFKNSLLLRAAPNPFNPHIVLSFDIPRSSSVSLVIYSTNGRKINALVNTTMEQGTHRILWDGRDQSGRRVASGSYTVHLEAAGLRETLSVVLLK